MAIKFIFPALTNNSAAATDCPLGITHSMQERILATTALLLVLCIGTLALFWHPEPPSPPLPRPGLPAGGDFVLETATGKVSLADFKGKSLLLFFGYTTCPDICPTGLITLTDALEQLEPDEKSRVAVLFVSVDPARDTPAHLAEFTAFFDPAIIGATASPGVIADLARRYDVVYHFAENGAVDHSADIFLINGKGRVVDKIAHGTPATTIATTLRQQLKAQ